MSRENVISLLGSHWTAFENQIREALRSDIPLLDSINTSLLSNSGKQLRPMLTLLCAMSCLDGGSAGAAASALEAAVPLAAAVELLHNASLLHDDVADRSPVRRGQPTLASALGPTAAVLVGDFWLSRAVRLVSDSPLHESVTPLFVKTLSYLAEGEMLQMQKAASADTVEEDCLRIIYCKTASLFETASLCGAIAAGAPEPLCKAAAGYGTAVGMAFQIRDDIFDYQDSAETGKPAGIDLQEQKITLPLLGAIRNNPVREEEIRAMLREIPDKPGSCEYLRTFAIEGGGLEYAADRLNDYIQEALSALELFPASPQRDAMAELARYNAIRKS